MSIKLKGLARTTGQIPVGQGDSVDMAMDPLGRQLIRFQVRDLIQTASASLTGGTKTVLATGSAGEYLDLYQITLSNNSDAAVVVSLTDESTDIMNYTVGAAGRVNEYYQIPIKQSASGVGWYVDIPDISGTTVTITAAFSREK